MRLDGFGLLVDDMPTMIRFTGMYWDLKSKRMKIHPMCISSRMELCFCFTAEMILKK